jgi:SAM-dependent methyltransferase
MKIGALPSNTMDRLMGKQKIKSSRELGLELAAICGTHFFKLEHLHYGYWTLDLKVDLANLHKAQEQYTDFLISNIPHEVKTILDVGCGTGHIARKLIDKGYKVDCVSPSPFLNERVRTLLGDGAHIYESLYEQLKTDRRYDLVLFSESFQYVNMAAALKNTRELLNKDGYLLICDVFRMNVEQNGTMGGGHKLKKFHDLIEQCPFEPVKDIDITPQTAPNLDLLDETMTNVAAPALEAGLDYLSSKYRLMAKFLRWKYKKQIDRMYAKYFNGKRSAEDFRRYKTYRFLLYKKVNPVIPCIGTSKNSKEPAFCCSSP